MAHVPKLGTPAPRSPETVERGGLAPGGKLPGEKVNDRELVRRAQGEDKEAFEELVRRHQQRVFAVANGILHRREDVEDIGQQVFVKAYFSLKRFDQRSAFTTWLYKITVNECWDLLRKRKVRPLVYESDLSEDQARQYTASGERASATPDTSDRLIARQEVGRLLEHIDERTAPCWCSRKSRGLQSKKLPRCWD